MFQPALLERMFEILTTQTLRWWKGEAQQGQPMQNIHLPI